MVFAVLRAGIFAPRIEIGRQPTERALANDMEALEDVSLLLCSYHRY